MQLEEYTKMDKKTGKEVTKQRYPRVYGKRRKEQHRQESQERAKDWSKLTAEQKLKELDKRSGECRKQKERLLKGIESGGNQCTATKRKQSR